ncbi:hypothetical protein ZHAS_00000693 [Anopheles sinensis]|uniref:Uncharacterized protein n=1 Tax=Anopheles sinensis TaxID=74873 RepID=A0A084VAF7_ANOSI|nr:hypothetical protein ZHAS_00000693 [Anopheles sinensis]
METLPAINNPYPALATVLRQQQPPPAPTAAENWLYEIRQKGQDSTYYVMVQNVKDLVKSHLMFAVREEVEVLKERISELMDRINQLEYENNILKANASQETLAQLTTGGNSVAAVAAAAQQQQQQQQQQVSTAAAAAAAAAALITGGTTKVPPSPANPANGSVS